MSVSLCLRRVRLACVAFVLLAVTGCAVVDQYSGRAIVYNLQAEQAQQQQLLLNVVRASQRRPMQFTGLQTITGTASASGNLSATDAMTRNATLLTTPANTVIGRTFATGFGAGGSISGGPTFTVPVLDTQEFYQGLLTPISGQLLDLYLQAGYPRDVLFNLVMQRIILKRHDGPCRVEVHTTQCELIVRNYVLGDVDLELFQSLMGYFIHLGLNTEPIIQKAASAKGKADDKAAADTGPKLKPFAFCFSPRDPSVYGHINRAVLCGHPAAAVQLKESEIGRKAVIGGVPLQREFINRLYQRAVVANLGREVGAEGFRDLNAFAGKQVSVSFHTRSIEEILYYLGEVVRRAAARSTAGGQPAVVQVRVGPPQNEFPLQVCPFEALPSGYVCKNMFVVEQGGLTTSGISVDYEGERYSISADSDASWSMAVMDIVKQLLAVNTSAKQLPASNLISVISNQ